jgi:hypothetical protein
LVSIVENNSLSIADVYESVDLCYEVNTSLLTEVLTLKERKEFERLIQKISWVVILRFCVQILFQSPTRAMTLTTRSLSPMGVVTTESTGTTG